MVFRGLTFRRRKRYVAYAKRKMAVRAKYYRIWLKFITGEYFANIYYYVYDIFFDRFYQSKFYTLKEKGLDIIGTGAWADFEVKSYDIESENILYQDMLKDYQRVKTQDYKGLHHELSFHYYDEYIMKPYSDFFHSWFSINDFLFCSLFLVIFIYLFHYYWKFLVLSRLGFIIGLLGIFYTIKYNIYLNVLINYSLVFYYNLLESESFYYSYIFKLAVLYGVAPHIEKNLTIFSFGGFGDSMCVYQYNGLNDYVLEKENIRRSIFREEFFLKNLWGNLDYCLNYLLQNYKRKEIVRNRLISGVQLNSLDLKNIKTMGSRVDINYFSNNKSIIIRKLTNKIILMEDKYWGVDIKMSDCLDFLSYYYYINLISLTGLWSKFMLYLDNLVILKIKK